MAYDPTCVPPVSEVVNLSYRLSRYRGDGYRSPASSWNLLYVCVVELCLALSVQTLTSNVFRLQAWSNVAGGCRERGTPG